MADVTHNPVAPATEAVEGPASPRPKRLGERLLEDGALTPEQLQQGLDAQRTTGRLLGDVLVSEGLASSGAVVHALAASLGVPGVVLRPGLVDPALLEQLGEPVAKRLRVLPMFKVRGEMTVAMAEPQSLPTIDRLRELTGCQIRPVLAVERDLLEFVDKARPSDADLDSFLTSLTEQDVEVVQTEAIDEGVTDLDQMVEGSPIVNLVNVALLTAIRDGASDIHIEPDKRGTRVRYRIDGRLRDLMKPPPGMHAAVVSRVKVIGQMDIAEKRLPQEGRVRIVAEGRDIDLRVSSIPTLLGEKLVIRVLDKANLRVRLEDLGFRDTAREGFTEMLGKPHGLVLVTGPTGSGKTTTLYSALDLLRNPETNIVTVEDPVEYQLDLINQIHVHEAVGLSFARALRSILRQDPDVIMVGEIRDQETARVAVQAALTGHLVLATLHTNDAPGAVARLLDMGIESYLLASALNGVVAQRLARRNCSACETKYYPSADSLEDAGLQHQTQRAFHKGVGCRSCHNSGYRGRVGIYEVMTINPELRRLVHQGAASHEIRAAFREHGGDTLSAEGVKLACDGVSSLEEILRVTRDEDSELDEPLPSPPAAKLTTKTGEMRGAA
jgi:type IV pilus assembly protein PilB